MFFDNDTQYDDFGNEIIKSLRKGNNSCIIVKTDNGDIVTDEEHYITNVNSPDWEDVLNEFVEDWEETHWDNSDWADYYGCDEDEVQDCMDDDIKDLY